MRKYCPELRWIDTTVRRAASLPIVLCTEFSRDLVFTHLRISSRRPNFSRRTVTGRRLYSTARRRCRVDNHGRTTAARWAKMRHYETTGPLCLPALSHTGRRSRGAQRAVRKRPNLSVAGVFQVGVHGIDPMIEFQISVRVTEVDGAANARHDCLASGIKITTTSRGAQS
jgi:hypothetical protein